MQCNKQKLVSKAFLKAFLALIAIFLSLGLVDALGVSPATRTVSFKPNTALELEFFIVNSEHNELQLSLSPVGELKDIIFFEKQVINLSSKDDRLMFKAILKMPSKLEPGIREGIIKITPMMPGASENMLAAYVAPSIPIRVRIPYPYKYADINVIVQSVDEGTPVPIYVEFDNLGSEKILKAGAELKLYEPNGKLISLMTAPDISIEKDSLGKSKAAPVPTLRRGIYSLIGNAYYDGITKVIETNFTIGNPVLRIRELMTKKLVTQPVNKVAFKAYNDWNTALEVTGFLEIKGKKTEMPVFRFEKNEEKEITTFLETDGLIPGSYNLSATWIYSNQIQTEVFEITLSEEKAKPSEALLKVLLATGIIILILVLISLVLLILKKRNKKKQEEIKINNNK